MKQLGAAKVVGVDISDEAIEFARKALSRFRAGGDVLSRSTSTTGSKKAARDDDRYDIVFCSYGAIIWLSDLASWAKGIAAVLKSGGRFVTVEFHPIEMMFEVDYSHKYAYSTHGKPLTWERRDRGLRCAFRSE